MFKKLFLLLFVFASCQPLFAQSDETLKDIYPASKLDGKGLIVPVKGEYKNGYALTLYSVDKKKKTGTLYTGELLADAPYLPKKISRTDGEISNTTYHPTASSYAKSKKDVIFYDTDSPLKRLGQMFAYQIDKKGYILVKHYLVKQHRYVNGKYETKPWPENVWGMIKIKDLEKAGLVYVPFKDYLRLQAEPERIPSKILYRTSSVNIPYLNADVRGFASLEILGREGDFVNIETISPSVQVACPPVMTDGGVHIIKRGGKCVFVEKKNLWIKTEYDDYEYPITLTVLFDPARFDMKRFISAQK
ncbi:hypothetical protein Dip518_000171 [Parelusimicrobium proximum]|uniref:hypothetical protein n=1 Tax=Parelusimicrobium proximum TaxID=3228953 RepID=UPI003D171C5E